MSFRFKSLGLKGLIVVQPTCFSDDRGIFSETYKKTVFYDNGIYDNFVQDNRSISKYGVLRGLHFQKDPHAQAKLVRVAKGTVLDVAVDLRHHSENYGKWEAVELSAENNLMLYIPQGFAHGFLSLSDDTELVYKCSAEYSKGSEGGIRWDDPDINIQWPINKLTVSEKDRALPFLKEMIKDD